MGRISSKVEPIASLTFEKTRKGRVLKNVDIMQIDESTAIVRKKNGPLSIIGRLAHLNESRYLIINFGIQEHSRVVLDGLVKMGVLTKDQVSEHVENEKKVSEEKDRKNLLKRLSDICNDLGIPVPEVDK
jgi:hypothetical protein